MGPFEAIVVFVMVWWVTFLPILSWGTRSQHEAGEVVPGSERGAPTAPGLGKKALIATLVASAFTLVMWLGFQFGWWENLIPQTYR